MPDSSSEDQLDTIVLSGQGPSCSVLATYEKYIRLCWHRTCCKRGPMVPITHFRWACHISTVWHFGVAAGGKQGRRQKKNTLQEDYAPGMPSLLQEFVMLHLVCKCECVWEFVSVVFVWFARVYAFIRVDIW